VTETVALDQHPYLSLATYRRTGVVVPTPVWFAAAANRLYVFTAGDAGKVKRLRRSPRARVAPCNARGRVSGAWRDATARLVDDERSIRLARGALHAKYGWQLVLLDFAARLTGRLQRRAWIEIEVQAPGRP
jgi:PPOX class probable F420-dependent enzyme